MPTERSVGVRCTIRRRITSHPQVRRVAMIAPALVFLVIVFVYPIANTLKLSFLEGDVLTLEHYARVINVPLYFQAMRTTFQVSVACTLLTLVLAYPLAYTLSMLPTRRSVPLLGLVALPWFTSILVRSYAWMVLLGRAGIVNRTLQSWGLIQEPLPLLYNAFGVYVAMVHVLLPYMVFSLFGVMKGIDRSLIDAAQSAGASPFRAFAHVYFPLSLPGVAGGALLVFVMAAGYFVTPALLGSPQETMIAQVITMAITDLLQWEFGAALATVLLVITTAVLLVYNRFLGFDRLLGGMP